MIHPLSRYEGGELENMSASNLRPRTISELFNLPLLPKVRIKETTQQYGDSVESTLLYLQRHVLEIQLDGHVFSLLTGRQFPLLEVLVSPLGLM